MNRVDLGSVTLAVVFIITALVLLYIAYKKLLQRLGKKPAAHAEQFIIFHPFVHQPLRGTVDFFLEAKNAVSYQLYIQSIENHSKWEVEKGVTTRGGNILPFDTRQLKNGLYWATLETDFQKTTKRIEVRNPQ